MHIENRDGDPASSPRPTGESAEPAKRGLEAALGAPDMDDFEDWLVERTKVPAERLQEFLTWQPEMLAKEAGVVTKVLRRFANAVVRAIDDPDSADNFLQALDLKAISRDHDWRGVFSTVMAQSGNDTRPHKRAVLVSYLQYLSFRKRLVEFIHSRKLGLEETDSFSDFTRFPRGRGAERSLDDAIEDGTWGATPPGFSRLPMGEPVALEFSDSLRVEFMLGSHLFRLLGGRAPSLIDQNGVSYFLRNGRNMVGRHPEGDVVVDQDFGDVSRAHAVLEWRSGTAFTLTDLSSRGTFVAEDNLGTEF